MINKRIMIIINKDNTKRILAYFKIELAISQNKLSQMDQAVNQALKKSLIKN